MANIDTPNLDISASSTAAFVPLVRWLHPLRLPRRWWKSEKHQILSHSPSPYLYYHTILADDGRHGRKPNHPSLWLETVTHSTLKPLSSPSQSSTSPPKNFTSWCKIVPREDARLLMLAKHQQVCSSSKLLYALSLHPSTFCCRTISTFGTKWGS